MMIRQLDNRFEKVVLNARMLARFHVETQGWYVYYQEFDFKTNTLHLHCDYLKEDGAYKTRADKVSYLIKVEFRDDRHEEFQCGSNEIVFHPPILLDDNVEGDAVEVEQVEAKSKCCLKSAMDVEDKLRKIQAKYELISYALEIFPRNNELYNQYKQLDIKPLSITRLRDTILNDYCDMVKNEL